MAEERLSEIGMDEDLHKESQNEDIGETTSGLPIAEANERSPSRSPSRSPKRSPKRVKEEEERQWIQIPTQTGQKLEYYEQLIKKNKWDADARENLIKECLRTNDKVLIKRAFQSFLDQFPTCTRIWIKWIEYEKEQLDYDELEKIFQKSIRDVPVVELYIHYLEYIQHIHSPLNPTPEEQQEAQEIITKAYDYVLNAVGTDKESGQLWMNYIQFVKNSNVSSSYEEQQKMDLLRKIFHKAIHTPIHNIEDIWKEYDAFENNLSKLTAKKFVADRAAGYMTARAAIKDQKALLEPIDYIEKRWVACPPTWSNIQIQLLNLWKRYIAWETSNPLHLEDKSLFLGRVLYAYKSAMISLRHFPEIWFDCANFLLRNDRLDDCIALLKQGVQINDTSLLLSFTLAEVLESKYEEFEKISVIFDELLEKLELKYKEQNEKYDQERIKLMKVLKETLLIEDDNEDEGEKREREREIAKEHEKEVELRVEQQRKISNLELKKMTSLVWIVYMRLSRRSQSIRAARLIFSKARKSEMITSHVFTASALMEYYVNKDPTVAGKIFELGMKSFPLAEDPESTEYIIRYLDFLICLNDDNNTRALFERSLAVIPKERSKPIWDKYNDYETQYGDLSNVYRIEKRFNEQFAIDDANSIENVVKISQKWSYYDICSVGEVELGIEALKRIRRLPPPNVQIKLAQGTENRQEKGRKVAMLGGVDVEKFPRPEISRWNMYKAEPGLAKQMNVVTLNDDFKEQDISTGLLVPEPIARLISILPRKESYNGPSLNIQELLGVLVNCSIMLPASTNIKYVGLPQGRAPKRSRDESDSGNFRSQKSFNRE